MKKNGLNRTLIKIFLILFAINFLCITTGCSTKETKETIIIKPAEPSSSVKTIFFDDFNTTQSINRNMWVSNGKAHWVWQGKTSANPGCVDGCLKQNSEDINALNAVMYVQTPQMTNGVIETKTRMNFDKSIAPTPEEKKRLRFFIGTGIVFRMSDVNNYYMFRLAGEEGCVLGKMVNGKWVDLDNPRRVRLLEGGRIKPNVWYTLKVQVYGNNIQCFINDSPVINYTDDGSKGGPPFTVGHFGLITFKCFADFEYINVYQ